MLCMRAGSLPPFARRMRRGRLLAAAGAWLLLASVAAYGASSVQRCTDKDGKVTYSDRPCQNESAKAAPAPPPAVSRTEPKAGLVSYAQDSSVFQDLQGSWSAANVTLERQAAPGPRTDAQDVDLPDRRPLHRFGRDAEETAPLHRRSRSWRSTRRSSPDRQHGGGPRWLADLREGARRVADRVLSGLPAATCRLRGQRRVTGHSPCAPLRVGSGVPRPTDAESCGRPARTNSSARARASRTAARTPPAVSSAGCGGIIAFICWCPQRVKRSTTGASSRHASCEVTKSGKNPGWAPRPTRRHSRATSASSRSRTGRSCN